MLFQNAGDLDREQAKRIFRGCDQVCRFLTLISDKLLLYTGWRSQDYTAGVQNYGKQSFCGSNWKLEGKFLLNGQMSSLEIVRTDKCSLPV